MPEFQDLPDEMIDEALADNRGSRTYQVPGTKKKVKYDPSVRTVSNWFKLPHTLQGECQMPNHNEEREPRDKPRLFYVLDDGRLICRWCFVESRDLGT